MYVLFLPDELFMTIVIQLTQKNPCRTFPHDFDYDFGSTIQIQFFLYQRQVIMKNISCQKDLPQKIIMSFVVQNSFDLTGKGISKKGNLGKIMMIYFF